MTAKERAQKFARELTEVFGKKDHKGRWELWMFRDEVAVNIEPLIQETEAAAELRGRRAALEELATWCEIELRAKYALAREQSPVDVSENTYIAEGLGYAAGEAHRRARELGSGT